MPDFPDVHMGDLLEVRRHLRPHHRLIPEGRGMSGPQLFPCVRCNRTVRPSHRKPEDYPGVETLSFGGRGLCGACAYHFRKQGSPEPTPDPEAEARNLAYIERGLASFIARRNARLSKYRLAA